MKPSPLNILSPGCICCPALSFLSEAFVMPRRMFLLGAGSFAAAVALGNKAEATSPGPGKQTQISQATHFADAIYINATVITVNDKQPTAEAVAVKDGKILAVGDRNTIEALRGSETQIFDLAGKTLVPGFIDPHGHFFQQGVTSFIANLLPPPDGDVDSISKIQDKLRAWSQTPIATKFSWILGNGYDDSQLKENRHPTREELDAVSTELPVLIVHQSGHLGAVNSKALELLKINADTENPPGGVIRREAGSNQPNGVLEENAIYLALSRVAKTIQLGPGAALNIVKKGGELYARYGYTTAQEGRAIKGVYEALKAAAAEGSLPVDVAVYVDYLAHPDAHTWGVSRTYTDRLRLAGVKLTFDGSPQGRTAWLTQPFYKPPEGQPADYKGYGVYTEEQAIALIDSAYENNTQILAHCSGDAAMDQMIRALRKATEKHGSGDRRPVLIHGHTVREDQLDDFNELGVFPALFPAHVFYWGDWHREVTMGPERAARMSPTRSALNRGMKVSIHTDSPVVLPNATRTMWSAVNRRTRTNFLLGEDQRLTPLEALKAVTIWAAYQHFEEEQKGSIEPGKLADFVILSANPLTVDPMNIKDIDVVETIKEGKTIYKADTATT